MNKKRPLIVSLALLLAISMVNVANATTQFTAQVDRNTLSVEETLTLQLRYYEQVLFGEPDLSQLENNFDILSQRRNQQYHSVNGKAESWTQWKITLAPKREGKLLIPSFEFKGAFTDAIEVQVKKSPVYSGQVANQPVFMEVALDKTSAFVQEQIIYTVRLFTSVNLHSLDRTDFDVQGAEVKKISENQYQKTINGKAYGVVEIKYALFPQQSGSLTVPSGLWSVVINQQNYRRDPFYSDPFARNGKKINLRTPEKTVNILAQPGTYDADVWLPARQIELQQSWSQAPDTFKVGEPITRNITIKAEGVTAAQLPPLTIEPMTGLSYYPDQPQSDEQLSAQGVTTIKQESYAIVANKPGTITLPAVTLKWWDTEAKRMRESRLPIQTIQVEGTAAPVAILEPEPTAISADEANPTQTTNSNPVWFYTTLLTTLSTLLFAGLWLSARRSGHPMPTPDKKPVKPAIDPKALHQALESGDPTQARQALIQWGQTHFDDSGLTGLQQLARYCDDTDFSESLTALDHQLYGSEEQRLPPALIDALKQGIGRVKINTAEQPEKSSLPPLYKSA
ncbi:BatD family protein [Candidatus Pelagadaptatus aseana]|uniref:BatD family protein n=1 Tax=Candidatus Pelagadaptatus aseana TaxID=3120508 RepID=UPI003C6F2192